VDFTIFFVPASPFSMIRDDKLVVSQAFESDIKLFFKAEKRGEKDKSLLENLR